VSEQNIELLRGFTEAYNARDEEALISYCDPSIEAHSAFATVGDTVYHGHAGVRRIFRDMEEAWGKDIRSEPEAYFDLGDHTLSFGVFRGRGRQSGAEVVMPIAHVARWRDGLIVYTKSYGSREDALRDLGVSKDALEPIAP
jgi:ketosteroid isomerase-like protein